MPDYRTGPKNTCKNKIVVLTKKDIVYSNENQNIQWISSPGHHVNLYHNATSIEYLTRSTLHKMNMEIKRARPNNSFSTNQKSNSHKTL